MKSKQIIKTFLLGLTKNKNIINVATRFLFVFIHKNNEICQIFFTLR